MHLKPADWWSDSWWINLIHSSSALRSLRFVVVVFIPFRFTNTRNWRSVVVSELICSGSVLWLCAEARESTRIVHSMSTKIYNYLLRCLIFKLCFGVWLPDAQWIREIMQCAVSNAYENWEKIWFFFSSFIINSSSSLVHTLFIPLALGAQLRAIEYAKYFYPTIAHSSLLSLCTGIFNI